MNPGSWVAIHAATTAAAAAKARTHTLDAFRMRDATAPERARRLAELGLADDRAIRELISAGVVRGVDSHGRLTVLGDSVDRVAGYYLDEAEYIAHRDRAGSGAARWNVVALALGMTVALAVAALVVMMAARR